MSVPLPKKEGGGDIGVVNSGQTTLVPLWIRGDRIGKHSFKFLFSYQSEVNEIFKNLCNYALKKGIYYSSPFKLINFSSL